MRINSTALISLIIAALAALLFMPYLGSVHLFDWDENIFAESAREMLVTGNYYSIQSNFQPFQEKPPFFFWLQAISMTIFGVNEFAARFPNAIIGMTTLVLLFLLGKKYFNTKFGIFWSLAYLGSFLPHFYFRTALIDPTFNLFIFSGVFTLAIFVSTNTQDTRKRNLLISLAGMLIGFAILTKGPVAFLITSLTALGFMIYKKSIKILTLKEFFLFLIPMLLVASAWFVIEVIINGPWFIREFIEYQIYVLKKPHSGHSGPFYFHFIVLLLGCFPVSFFIFKALRPFDNDNFVQRNIKTAMIIMMIVVLFIFSIVKTKLVHYSSLCYFPISFLAAYALQKYESRRLIFGNWFKVMILFFGLLVGFILLAVNYILLNKEMLLEKYSKLIKDDFALGNLSAPLQVSSWEYMTGFTFLLGIILFVFLFRKNFMAGTISMFICTILTVQMTTYNLVPKIENMVQGEAVNFYKEKGKEDAYLYTYKFKSFAYLFYGRKKPDYNSQSLDENWLLTGEIDKPVYIVAKAYEKRKKQLEEYPDLKKLYAKNGYVFYIREPSK